MKQAGQAAGAEDGPLRDQHVQRADHPFGEFVEVQAAFATQNGEEGAAEIIGG